MIALVVMLVAASPSSSIKLASPGLSAVNVTPALQNFVTDHVNQQLVLEGIDVLSSSQVAAVVGLERQKQLLGCADESNCIAEIASALGVDGLVLGNIAKFGEKLQLDVRVAAATDARNLAAFSIAIESDAGLPDAISKAATAIATQLSAAMGRPLKPVVVPTEKRWTLTKKAGMFLTFGGAAGLIGSFAVLLASPSLVPGQPEPPNYGTWTAAGFGLLIGGTVALLAGSVMWIFGGSVDVPVTAGLAPTADGFSFALGGRF